jgi:hypothetical protein
MFALPANQRGTLAALPAAVDVARLSITQASFG